MYRHLILRTTQVIMRTVGETFQMLTLTWVTVIVLSLIIDLTGGDFRVFKGDADVTNSVLVNESDAQIADFDDPSLPNAIKGNSVALPLSLKVSFYDEEHNSTFYQGATFEWRSPFSVHSRLYLKGFYVEIHGKSSPDRYKLYILNVVGFKKESLTFKMDMNTFSRTTDDFIVRVYSMPSEERYRNDADNFQYLYLRTVVPNNSAYFYQNEWSPSIAYKPLLESKNVDIYLSLPPEGDNWLLTQFRVNLLSCSEANIREVYSVNKTRNAIDAEGFLRFEQLRLDESYSIVVEVDNYNKSLCICQTKFAKCAATCGFTQTKEFSLPRNEHLSELSSSMECEFTRTTPADTSKSKYDMTTQNVSTIENAITKRNASNDDSTTVAVVIATLVLITAMVFVILIIVRHHHSRKGRDNDQATENHAVPKAAIADIPLEEKVKELQRKTVYIVAASDHAEADNLLEKFSDFLQVHCQCEVINPCHANLHQTQESAWVTSKMRSSDYIIFVNSFRTAKLLDVYLESIAKNSNPPQSIISEALHFSFNKESGSKFITVTFHQDWIKDSLGALNPKRYFLPSQLPHFLCGIHNLSEREAENYKGQLPLNMKCLNNLPQWQPFVEAVCEMENFENSKLLTETEDHDTTPPPPNGFFKGPLSVSMTDLTINTDVPEHPTAKNSSYSQSSKNPGNRSETEPLKSTNQVFSNLPRGHYDDFSFVTVGKVSDLENNASQKPSQSVYSDKQITVDNPNYCNDHEAGQCEDTADHLPESCQIFPDRNLRPKVSVPASSAPIVPPRVNVKPPCDDSISNMLSTLNDNESVWLQQPDTGKTGLRESREESEKPPSFVNHNRSRKIKPPPTFIPPDNFSSALQALNEEDYTDLPPDFQEDDVDEISV